MTEREEILQHAVEARDARLINEQQYRDVRWMMMREQVEEEILDEYAG